MKPQKFLERFWADNYPDSQGGPEGPWFAEAMVMLKAYERQQTRNYYIFLIILLFAVIFLSFWNQHIVHEWNATVEAQISADNRSRQRHPRYGLSLECDGGLSLSCSPSANFARCVYRPSLELAPTSPAPEVKK